jgi:hypothetical protein
MSINRIKLIPKHEEQASINEWLLQRIESRSQAVFVTLKFRHKINEQEQKDDIATEHAKKLLRIFLRKLDSLFYSERAIKKRIAAIPRAAFQHMGFSGDNVHFHLVMFPPIAAAEFVEIAERTWANMDKFGWIDTSNSEFTVVGATELDLRKATLYCAREVRKLGLENSWLIYETHMPAIAAA